MKMLKNSTIKWLGLLLLGVTVSAHGISDKQSEAISERIKPVGSVCLEGDSNCGAVAAAPTGAQSPEDIFNTNCTACHSTGVANAPKLGDAADWSARLEKGLDQVYSNAINGLNVVMPAKGLCMTCSDDDIKGVVDYMVENSQ